MEEISISARLGQCLCCYSSHFSKLCMHTFTLSCHGRCLSTCERDIAVTAPVGCTHTCRYPMSTLYLHATGLNYNQHAYLAPEACKNSDSLLVSFSTPSLGEIGSFAASSGIARSCEGRLLLAAGPSEREEAFDPCALSCFFRALPARWRKNRMLGTSRCISSASICSWSASSCTWQFASARR